MNVPFSTDGGRLEAFSDAVRAMWANLHLLFWLSLVPFATAWLGEHPTAAVPTALDAFVQR
jgi:uncharacterized membrane protein